MTFLAFCSANLFNCYAIEFVILDIIVELFVNAVEFVTRAFFRIVKINLCFPVAVDAPAHAEFSKLVNFIHLGNLTMAGLALLFTYFHVL